VAETLTSAMLEIHEVAADDGAERSAALTAWIARIACRLAPSDAAHVCWTDSARRVRERDGNDAAMLIARSVCHSTFLFSSC
jgi:hypothetical protein